VRSGYEDLRSDVIDSDPKLLINVMTYVNADILGRPSYFGVSAASSAATSDRKDQDGPGRTRTPNTP
jgi:hypothetical protein